MKYMEKDLLARVRKLNWVLQESASGAFSFRDLCEILSDLMDANVYITNKRGKVIGVHYKIQSDSSIQYSNLKLVLKIPKLHSR